MSEIWQRRFSLVRGAVSSAVFIAALAGCSGSTGPGERTASGGIDAAAAPGNVAPGNTVAAVAAPDPSGNDWPNFGRDYQHTRNSPQTAITLANVATLAPKWGTGSAHPLPRGFFDATYADPVVVGNVVYQAALNGSIDAFDLSSGALLWTFTGQSGTSMKSTPTYYRGTLYAGDMSSSHQNATFYAVNAATGKAHWQYVISDPLAKFDGSPVVWNSAVYIGLSAVNEVPGKCVHARQLMGFSVFAPALAATLTLTPPPQNGADIWSTPMLDPQGNMYLATGNECTPNFNQSFPYANALLRAKANPQLGVQWSFQIPEGPGRDLDFGSSPVYAGGLVVDTSKDGYTYALNPATGALVWKTFTGMALGSSATDGSKIYVPSAQTVFPACLAGATCGGLYALNLADGSIAWSIPATTDKNGVGMRSSPVYSNGMVFGAWNGQLWAVSAANGTPLWSYAFPANAQNEIPAVYGGIALVNGGLILGATDQLDYWCFTPGGV
jgi:outer membrane protein assembly factor BamB